MTECHPMNRLLATLLLSTLIPFGGSQAQAQTSGSPSSVGGASGVTASGAAASQSDKEKIMNKNVIAIDKGCVVGALIVKNKLIDKQNNKFNLLATFEELKTSQMAFIQRSTLSAYLVYLDAIEPADINPTLMSSQYMLNCLSFVRH